MNNPGIDFEMWKQLRKKWSDLSAAGHQLKIQFKLITDPVDKNKVLAIDVIQKIDEETLTETVQHISQEAYALLGIAGVSLEQIIGIYRQFLEKAYRQAGQDDKILIVAMSPTSPTSGEVKAVLAETNSERSESIQVNYQHYYILTALREKMIEVLGDEWRKVKAIYQRDNLEFYFEY